MYPILSTHWKFDQKKKKTYLFEAKSEEMIAKKKKKSRDGPKCVKLHELMISERPTMEQPTNPTRESYGPSTRPHPSSPHMEDDAAILAVAGRHRRIPPLAAAAEGLAMTTAPHELIGSRRAVGEEASTAVEETPAAGFCRR